METYRYQATTSQGEETAGIIEAASFDDAVRQLRDRGLRDVQVFQAHSSSSERPPAPVSLTSNEAVELSQHVAHVSAANVPLSAGLEAAAEETTDPRVAAALLWMADQLEQGRTLEEILTESGRLLPPYITGLMLAAARTGRLGEALFELVELQQKTFTLRREVSSGYIYPLAVVALAAVIVLVTGYYVTGVMKKMMEEFELALPMMTRVLYWWRETGIWILVGLGVVLVVAGLALRLFGGRVAWRRLMATAPLYGPLWHWTGVAEWAGLLSVLLRHEVPLPDALRWAGRGVGDAFVSQLSMRLADGVARGRTLSQMLHTIHSLPSSLIPMVHWGEQSGTLGESFQVGQDMLQHRVRMRAILLQSVIPPLLFLGVGSVILFVLIATFSPLIGLISSLS